MSDLHTTTGITSRSVPLPATVEDLLAQRRPMIGRTLNDYVEDLHVKAWANPAYQAVLEAVYDEDAVEGSLAADNLMAAQMLREIAREHDVPQVANRKLATIVKALNVVLKRFRMSRQLRAITIGGQTVPNSVES
jgi:hypothetical protein